MKRLCSAGLILCFCASALAAQPDAESFLRSLRVPPGFKIEFAAGEPDVRFPMFACFDDLGRLYVAESSGKDLYAGLQKLTRDCRVLRLEDTNGDGRFDRRTVFQESVTFPMGLAWHDGKLFLADPPELVALTDSDNDGRADKREVVLTGFGHTDNGSLHGLTFGPDGFLYFTMGEPDGWKIPRGDGQFLEGVAGALFRSRPDGSELEVICRGFENLVEVEFLPGGEIIGTDNWYQKPLAGLRDALIDCSPGGLYPYAPDRGTPLPRSGILLPPVGLFPAVAHSGITRLRASAFPEEWGRCLFVAEHNTRKVVAHQLRAEGSTFASSRRDFVVGEHPDFHPSDVLEDADGSLLIVDTGGWYVEHCPTGRIRDSRAGGGIYRVRWADARETVDPRGATIKWARLSSNELVRFLSDPRPTVADRAARELARKRDSSALMKAAEAANPLEVRLRSVWALASFAGDAELKILRVGLNDRDPSFVCAAVRALATLKDKTSADALASLLKSTNGSVRRAAAEGLSRCGSREQGAALLEALVTAGDDFEEHACVVALLAVGDEPFVRTLVRHSSSGVRRAGLNILDQPPFGTLRFTDLVSALGDEDERLCSTGLQLMERHPAWAAEALPWLREQLVGNRTAGSNTAALANLLVAFRGNPAVREMISQVLDAASPASDNMRGFLIKLLPSLAPKEIDPKWLEAINAGLRNAQLRAAAIGAATAFQVPKLEEALTQVAEDPVAPTIERLYAARATRNTPVLSEGIFSLTLKAVLEAAGKPERLAAEDLLSHARLTPVQTPELIALLRTNSAIPLEPFVVTLVRNVDEKINPLMAEFFSTRLKAGWSPPRAVFEQMLTIFHGDLQPQVAAQWEKNNSANLLKLKAMKGLLNGGDPAQGRELFNVGCSSCHRVGAVGGVVGPDLTKIGAIRSGDDLLESIIFPSSTFAQGYEPISITTRDGEQFSGTLVSQNSDEVRLREVSGLTRPIRSGGIVSIKRQELSLMPEGMEKLFTEEQFRDLLAYLQNLK